MELPNGETTSIKASIEIYKTKQRFVRHKALAEAINNLVSVQIDRSKISG